VVPAEVPLLAQSWVPWVESVAVKSTSLPRVTGAEATVAPKLIVVNDNSERISSPSIWGRLPAARRRAFEPEEGRLNRENMDDHPSW
jgi:hypothetical protein